MIRSSRLMATMLAALFAAVLATPAYATGTGSTCDSHSRTYGTSGCKAEGTKFNDLDADGKRDSGEPGLAGWRIWADYDDDGVRDSGEPYDDTDSLGRYSLVVTNTTAYRLREQRPSGGTGGWKCSYPNASTSGGFASGKGGDFGCGWGPIASDAVNGKDFGNYKQPKSTVIKKLVPAGDPRALRPQGRQHGGQGGSRRRRQHPRQPRRAPRERDRGGRHRPGGLKRRSPATRRPRRPTGRAGSTRSRATRSPARSPTPASARSRSPRSPTRTRRAARSSASPASRARSTCPMAA